MGARGHGGRRPGAGRKEKAIKFAAPIATAEQRICDHLPELIDLAVSLARGVPTVLEGKDGAVTVFTTPPDFRAIAYLVDRVMGKPKQSVDLRHDIAALSDDELVAMAAGEFAVE